MSSPARRISIAFVGITLFVTTQLLWWNVFFARFSNNASHAQLEQWKSNQKLVRALYRELNPPEQRKLIQRCTKAYPHLDCSPPLFAIRPSALHTTLHEKHRYQRMFLFEGCFFFFIFIGGLFVLWLGIRAERELKHRQQNFLSAVSHEMRTPISTMRLSLETLQMRELSKEKQTKYLDRLGKQMDRLQHTCEQVVAAAMLDAPNSQRRLRSDDLNERIQEIIEHAQPDLEDRGAQVSWTLAPRSLPVQIDQSALSLIVNNLLENAVKYNEKDEKKVHVHIAHKGSWAHVRIEDNGPGIPIEEQKKVFTPFYRVGQELTRQKDGLGLGLYLVKGLTESMKGHVRYEALPEGSRFTLEWPIKATE